MNLSRINPPRASDSLLAQRQLVILKRKRTHQPCVQQKPEAVELVEPGKDAKHELGFTCHFNCQQVKEVILKLIHEQYTNINTVSYKDEWKLVCIEFLPQKGVLNSNHAFQNMSLDFYLYYSDIHLSKFGVEKKNNFVVFWYHFFGLIINLLDQYVYEDKTKVLSFESCLLPL